MLHTYVIILCYNPMKYRREVSRYTEKSSTKTTRLLLSTFLSENEQDTVFAKYFRLVLRGTLPKLRFQSFPFTATGAGHCG